MEFIMKMGEAGDMGDDMEKMMEVMCPFKDAIVCIATSPVCIDEGAEEQMAGLMAIPCLCACPMLSTMGEVGDTPTADQCKGMACVMGAGACEPMMKMMSTEDA